MADNFKIGAGLALDGESDFKKAVTDINKDLSVLSSEMKKVTAQFDGNSNSMEALTAKQKIYNERADEQRKKIEVMTTALENAKKEYGENSDKVKDWQIKLNNAEASLAKTESSLKQTTQQIDNFGKEANDGGDEIEKAGKKAKNSGDDAEKGESGWSKLGTGISRAGAVAAKAAAAIGAAALGAATGVGAMTLNAAQNADEINTLAKQTGLSTEEIQKFQYASEQIDVPMETLTGSMAKLTKNMGTAQKGTGDAANAFKTLGIEITNQDGSLRDNQDVFNEALNALGNMENATQRDAYAMQIFGKSAQDLNPLILGGADALKELGDQAEAAGLILGQDSLDNLNSLTDAMDTFKATLSGSGSLFATAFAGPMAEGINTITGYMNELTTAFNTGGFSALSTKFGEILSEVVNKIVEYLPKLLDVGIQIISTVIEGITENIGTITEGATTIIISLVNAIIELLPDILQAGIDVLIEFANGISDALPELVPKIVELMIKIVTTIVENLPKIAEAALKIIVALAAGLISSIPTLVAAVPDLIVAMKDAFAEHMENIKDIGKNIVEGVWRGIQNAKAWLLGKIKEWCGSILNGVKSFFGIESPSKEFAKVGGYMAQGLGNGFEKEMAAVTKQINNSIPTDVTMTGQYQATAKMGEGMVNAMAGLMQQGNSQPVIFQTFLNGKMIAQEMFDPLRNVAKQRGVAIV